MNINLNFPHKEDCGVMEGDAAANDMTVIIRVLLVLKKYSVGLISGYCEGHSI